MAIIHQPRMDTILMVEKAILESKDYPTRTALWKSLPTKIQYQTFKHILNFLEAENRIIFNDKKILYTGANNAKLRALIKSSVRVK
jgi:S-adenosylmethionine:tRNA-ribosyltransferase-isomerase (queuine synthetase)